MIHPHTDDGKDSPPIKEQILALGFLEAPGLDYYFLPLINWFFLEVVVVLWPTGSGSKPHDHNDSLNFSLIFPIGGNSTMIAEFFKVSRGTLVRDNDKVFTFTSKALHIVLPRQVHQLRQLEGCSISVNFYVPRRSQ
jgi:hypothetical protein